MLNLSFLISNLIHISPLSDSVFATDRGWIFNLASKIDVFLCEKLRMSAKCAIFTI